MKRSLKLFALIICISMVMSTCVYAAEEETEAAAQSIQSEEAVAAAAEEAESAPEETDLNIEAETAEGSEETAVLQDVSEEIAEETDVPETETEEISAEESTEDTVPAEGTDGSPTEETEAPGSENEEGTEEQEAETDIGSEDPETEAAADDPEEETEDRSDASDKEGEDADPESVDQEEEESAEAEEDESSEASKIKAEEETEAKSASGTALTIAFINANFGKCTLAVTGVPSGVSYVKILVWCSSDKSDKKWYKAAGQSDGTYTATVYKYLHSDHTGTYQARAYLYYSDGTRVYAGKRSFTVKDPSPLLKATSSGGEYEFTARYIQNASQVSYVRFAVWSENGGQDDLMWYDASFSRKNVSAYLTTDLSAHTDSGTYYVHAYAYTSSGAAAFIAGAEITINKTGLLASTGISTCVNNKLGKFRVTLQGYTSKKTVEKVRVVVWSQSDKSDKKWYTAADYGGGKYSAVGYIKNHNYYVGEYTARIKIYFTDGTSKYLSYTSFEFKVTSGKLGVGSGTEETTYPVTIKSLTVPAGAKSVTMAVWSETNGQDDIVWYTMSGSNGGDYTGTVNVKNHCSDGVYNVHIYAISRSGEYLFADATAFTVNPTASLNVTVSGRVDGDSCFKTALSIESSSSSCVLTKAAVWCKEDMSDIVWYPLSVNSNGHYVININTANHYGSRGKYRFSVYARFANGIEKAVKSFGRTFEPDSYIIVAKSNGTCERKIKYVNSSVSSVKFKVWTEKGGTADTVVYSAKVNSKGTFYATVDMDDFMCDGKYCIQVISGSEVLDYGSFIMIDYLEQAITYANDDSIGYSQIRRYLNPDVDCSALVYYSLKNMGYTVPGYAFSTYTMASDLQNAGFTLMNYTNVMDLQAGDILLRDGHTEIYAGNGLTVGAHEDEVGDIVGAQTGDQTGLEVCVQAIVENWRYAFRLVTYSS